MTNDNILNDPMTISIITKENDKKLYKDRLAKLNQPEAI